MNYFTHFLVDIGHISLPQKFTYPFNYVPHPIAIQAATELKQYIQNEIEVIHNFGLDEPKGGIGKMFGVLVVKNTDGEIGYLSAFSGKLGMKNEYEKFVPPVYDMLSSGGFYKYGEAEINRKSEVILQLENSKDFLQWQRELELALSESQIQIAAMKESKKNAKAIREIKRHEIGQWTDEEKKTAALKDLDRESAQWHYDLKHLQAKWKKIIGDLTSKIEGHKDIIRQARKQRKDMSIALQHRLFENYTFLNANKEARSLHSIFPIDTGELPPSGAGECAAPKLLHYAYAHDLEPICMAEFWYGKSPNSEIRKHGYFYPACKTKCLPILTHMLQGIEVEPNPLEDNPGQLTKLDIVYHDQDIVVVNKPHDFLSVPGKNIVDSIYTRLQTYFPECKELMVVHRLDMSTSGLILFAKNKPAHKHLQMQFLHKTIRKKYVAILDGEIQITSGSIQLPIAVDYENRPRQKVCYDSGKPARTDYEVMEVKNGQTLIYFYPISGRTHQLRVHAAHQLGLNTPILGDDLYGKRSQRLFLHAEELSFIHPSSQKEMSFKVEAGFKF